MNRAYSTFEVKEFDEGEGILRGIASTPSPDRLGDIVEPSGAKFALPLPLLWQHNSAQPIGNVISAKVTKGGIEVVAKVAKGVTAEIDQAWKLIKAGLVRGFSIGFRGLPGGSEPVNAKDPWGGVRFKSWEWLELSAVTIPANMEATIHAVKSLDRNSSGAASGASAAVPVVRFASPGVPGSPSNHPKEQAMTTETVRAMEAERAAKAARMGAILEKSQAESRTLTTEEQGQYDSIRDEVKAIDGHLSRLKEFENLTSAESTAVPSAGGNGSVKAGSDARGVAITHQRKNDDEPGIALARLVQCKGMSFLSMREGNFMPADMIAKERFRDDPRIAIALKAAVAAGTTTETTWAGPLVNEWGAIYADFVEYLRPRTILGRFGSGGIPSLRRVPFRRPLVGQTSGGAGYWVGEGAPKGLTKFDFSATNLDPLKVANIAVMTMELMRDSSPSASMVVRDQLVAALQGRLDADFIDPTKTAVSGVSPASISNGVTAISASGTDADAVRTDIKALFATFIAANNAPTNGVWIMSSTTALALSLMTNGLGQPEFPGINMNGGTFAGLPVITSEYVPSPTAGSYIFLVNASDVYLADEGGFTVDMSTEASVQMDSEPTNPPVAATVLVSLWQQNLVGFRAERTVNWSKRRASAVAVLDDVLYGTAS